MKYSKQLPTWNLKILHETQEGLVSLYLHIANIQYSKQNEPFEVLKHYVIQEGNSFSAI